MVAVMTLAGLHLVTNGEKGCICYILWEVTRSFSSGFSACHRSQRCCLALSKCTMMTSKYRDVSQFPWQPSLKSLLFPKPPI